MVDGVFNGLSDALALLSFTFASGPAPPCIDATDFDDSGVLNGLVDALGMLNFSFAGGAPPPGAVCGPDPTADGIGCEFNLSCF